MGRVRRSKVAPNCVAIIVRIAVRSHVAASAIRSKLHLSRRHVLVLSGFVLAAGIALFPIVHGPEPLPEPGELRELVVLVRPGPAFYFPGPDGVLTGFDVELARQFAAEKKLLLKFALAHSAAEVIAAIARGEAHIGAGGLYRPLASTASGKAAAPPDGAASAAGAVPPDVLWTTRVATAEPVLIYNRDGYKPASWSDLGWECGERGPGEGPISPGGR